MKKPDPCEAVAICSIWELKFEGIIFDGDSVIDMQTANIANMLSMGVYWGYISGELLIAYGAIHIINHNSDLILIVNS